MSIDGISQCSIKGESGSVVIGCAMLSRRSLTPFSYCESRCVDMRDECGDGPVMRLILGF